MKTSLYGLIFITSIAVSAASRPVDDISEIEGLQGNFKVNLESFKNLDELFAFAEACQKAQSSRKTSLSTEESERRFDLTTLLKDFQNKSLPTLRKFVLPPEFKIGNMYQSKAHKDIYIKYDSGIDMSSILPSVQDNGFRIFRKVEGDEIGYIGPTYLPRENKIYIAALWIKEELRSKGYGTKAMLTLIDLFNAKKASFPHAKWYACDVERKNEALVRSAQKRGFAEDYITEEERALGAETGHMGLRKAFGKKD